MFDKKKEQQLDDSQSSGNKTPESNQNGPQYPGDKTPKPNPIIKKMSQRTIEKITKDIDEEMKGKKQEKDPNLNISKLGRVLFSSKNKNDGDEDKSKNKKQLVDIDLNDDDDELSISSLLEKLEKHTVEAELLIQKFIKQNKGVNFRYEWMFFDKIVSYYEFHANCKQKDTKTKLFSTIQYIIEACNKYINIGDDKGFTEFVHSVYGAAWLLLENSINKEGQNINVIELFKKSERIHQLQSKIDLLMQQETISEYSSLLDAEIKKFLKDGKKQAARDLCRSVYYLSKPGDYLRRLTILIKLARLYILDSLEPYGNIGDYQFNKYFEVSIHTIILACNEIQQENIGDPEEKFFHQGVRDTLDLAIICTQLFRGQFRNRFSNPGQIELLDKLMQAIKLMGVSGQLKSHCLKYLYENIMQHQEIVKCRKVNEEQEAIIFRICFKSLYVFLFAEPDSFLNFSCTFKEFFNTQFKNCVTSNAKQKNNCEIMHLHKSYKGFIGCFSKSIADFYYHYFLNKNGTKIKKNLSRKLNRLVFALGYYCSCAPENEFYPLVCGELKKHFKKKNLKKSLKLEIKKPDINKNSKRDFATSTRPSSRISRDSLRKIINSMESIKKNYYIKGTLPQLLVKNQWIIDTFQEKQQKTLKKEYEKKLSGIGKEKCDIFFGPGFSNKKFWRGIDCQRRALLIKSMLEIIDQKKVLCLQGQDFSHAKNQKFALFLLKWMLFLRENDFKQKRECRDEAFKCISMTMYKDKKHKDVFDALSDIYLGDMFLIKGLRQEAIENKYKIEKEFEIKAKDLLRKRKIDVAIHVWKTCYYICTMDDYLLLAEVTKRIAFLALANSITCGKNKKRNVKSEETYILVGDNLATCLSALIDAWNNLGNFEKSIKSKTVFENQILKAMKIAKELLQYGTLVQCLRDRNEFESDHPVIDNLVEKARKIYNKLQMLQEKQESFNDDAEMQFFIMDAIYKDGKSDTSFDSSFLELEVFKACLKFLTKLICPYDLFNVCDNTAYLVRLIAKYILTHSKKILTHEKMAITLYPKKAKELLNVFIKASLLYCHYGPEQNLFEVQNYGIEKKLENKNEFLIKHIYLDIDQVVNKTIEDIRALISPEWNAIDKKLKQLYEAIKELIIEILSKEYFNEHFTDIKVLHFNRITEEIRQEAISEDNLVQHVKDLQGILQEALLNLVPHENNAPASEPQLSILQINVINKLRVSFSASENFKLYIRERCCSNSVLPLVKAMFYHFNICNIDVNKILNKEDLDNLDKKEKTLDDKPTSKQQFHENCFSQIMSSNLGATLQADMMLKYLKEDLKKILKAKFHEKRQLAEAAAHFGELIKQANYIFNCPKLKFLSIFYKLLGLQFLTDAYKGVVLTKYVFRCKNGLLVYYLMPPDFFIDNEFWKACLNDIKQYFSKVEGETANIIDLMIRRARNLTHGIANDPCFYINTGEQGDEFLVNKAFGSVMEMINKDGKNLKEVEVKDEKFYEDLYNFLKEMVPPTWKELQKRLLERGFEKSAQALGELFNIQKPFKNNFYDALINIVVVAVEEIRSLKNISLAYKMICAICEFVCHKKIMAMELTPVLHLELDDAKRIYKNSCLMANKGTYKKFFQWSDKNLPEGLFIIITSQLPNKRVLSNTEKGKIVVQNTLNKLMSSAENSNEMFFKRKDLYNLQKVLILDINTKDNAMEEVCKNRMTEAFMYAVEIRRFYGKVARKITNQKGWKQVQEKFPDGIPLLNLENPPPNTLLKILHEELKLYMDEATKFYEDNKEDAAQFEEELNMANKFYLCSQKQWFWDYFADFVSKYQNKLTKSEDSEIDINHYIFLLITFLQNERLNGYSKAGDKIIKEMIIFIKKLVPESQQPLHNYLHFIITGKIVDIKIGNNIFDILAKYYEDIIKFAAEQKYKFLLLLIYRDLFKQIFRDNVKYVRKIMPVFNLVSEKLELPQFDVTKLENCSLEYRIILIREFSRYFKLRIRQFMQCRDEQYFDAQLQIFYRECLRLMSEQQDLEVLSNINALEILCNITGNERFEYKNLEQADVKKLFDGLCGKGKPIKIFYLKLEPLKHVLKRYFDFEYEKLPDAVLLITNLQRFYFKELCAAWKKNETPTQDEISLICGYQIDEYIKINKQNENCLLIWITQVFCKWFFCHGSECFLGDELRNNVIATFEGKSLKQIATSLQPQMRCNIEVNDDKIKQEIFRRIFNIISPNKKNSNTVFFAQTKEKESVENLSLLIKRYYACYKVSDYIGDENKNDLRESCKERIISLFSEIKNSDVDIKKMMKEFGVEQTGETNKNNMSVFKNDV